MKIPKYIQDKMRRVAKLSAEVASIMSEVDAFFESKGFDTEFIRSGNGLGLEELELGNDIVNELVACAENDFQSSEWQ